MLGWLSSGCIMLMYQYNGKSGIYICGRSTWHSAQRDQGGGWVWYRVIYVVLVNNRVGFRILVIPYYRFFGILGRSPTYLSANAIYFYAHEYYSRAILFIYIGIVPLAFFCLCWGQAGICGGCLTALEPLFARRLCYVTWVESGWKIVLKKDEFRYWHFVEIGLQ